MTIKVYGHPHSTATLRTLLVLQEKDLKFELLGVDLLKGAHKAPEFMALQPFGQVPVLVVSCI